MSCICYYMSAMLPGQPCLLSSLALTPKSAFHTPQCSSVHVRGDTSTGHSTVVSGDTAQPSDLSTENDHVMPHVNAGAPGGRTHNDLGTRMQRMEIRNNIYHASWYIVPEFKPYQQPWRLHRSSSGVYLLSHASWSGQRHQSGWENTSGHQPQAKHRHWCA